MKKSILAIMAIIIALFYCSLTMSWAALSRTLKADEIQKLKDNITQDPSNVKSREFLAEHFAKVKDWPQVILYLHPIAEQLSDNSLNYLAQAYLATNDLLGAETVTQIMLSRKKVSISGVRMLVLIWSAQIRQWPTADSESIGRQQKIDQTIEIIKNAEQIYPRQEELFEMHIAFLKEFVSHYAFDALKVLDDYEENLKKSNPPSALSPKFVSMSCEFNYLANYTKKTIEVCILATQVDPKNHLNHIWLGRTLIAIDETKKGQRMLANVGKKFAHSESALRHTADFHLEAKNLPLAYQYYKKATEHPEASTESFLGLAKAAFELKKYQEALQAFTTHCQKTKQLHQEFRTASGLLKSEPHWQKTYRNTMRSCNADQ